MSSYVFPPLTAAFNLCFSELLPFNVRILPKEPLALAVVISCDAMTDREAFGYHGDSAIDASEKFADEANLELRSRHK